MSWRGAAAKTGHSIVMADPNKFKYVNDSFRHQAGDAVLREAAARMRSSFGCYDSVGRYGGEAWNLGERFRLLISASPFTFGHSVLAITCSIGATQLAGDSWEADSMIRLADEALYDAKNSGGNRIMSARYQLALQ